MVLSLSLKIGIGVLGLGTAGAVGYGVYELARVELIHETLLKNNLTVLDVNSEENGKWEQLVTKHNTNLNPPEGTTIAKLIFDGDPSPSTIDRAKLQNKCKNLFSKYFKSLEDVDYVGAKNWCTTFQIP